MFVYFFPPRQVECRSTHRERAINPLQPILMVTWRWGAVVFLFWFLNKIDSSLFSLSQPNLHILKLGECCFCNNVYISCVKGNNSYLFLWDAFKISRNHIQDQNIKFQKNTSQSLVQEYYLGNLPVTFIICLCRDEWCIDISEIF